VTERGTPIQYRVSLQRKEQHSTPMQLRERSFEAAFSICLANDDGLLPPPRGRQKHSHQTSGETGMFVVSWWLDSSSRRHARLMIP
jgi:hypothetical protein